MIFQCLGHKARFTARLSLLLAFTSAAHAQFTYTTNSDNTLNITGYNGPGGEVVIPDTFNGLPVTSIGNNALWFNTNITSITITNNVTSIGYQAFLRCSVLTNATIGSGVTNIGGQAFAYINSLLAINVDPLNNYYSSLDGVLFDPPQTKLIQCPAGKVGSYTVPATVTRIGDSAFYYCLSITSVTLPQTVTVIETNGFNDCGMTNILIGTNLTSIGFNAFLQSGLQNITLPASVTNIDFQPFRFCNRLVSISVDPLNPTFSSADGVLLDKPQNNVIQCPPGKSGNLNLLATVTNIGSYAFYGCGRLTNLVVSPGLVSISDWSFDGVGIKNLELPDSLRRIGPQAFENSSITDVTIGSGITNISDYAFANCFNFTRVCFRGNAPSLGGNVFYSQIYTGRNPTAYYPFGATGWSNTFGGLPALPWDPPSQCLVTNLNGSLLITGYIGASNSVTVPASVAGLPVIGIGSSAFSQKTSLTNITLPASVTNINSQAFYNCVALRSLQMPGVTAIGASAFQNCGQLQNIVLSPNLTQLGPGAFSGCASLSSLVLPGAINNLYLSFSGCTNLTSLFILGNAPTVTSAFVNDAKLTVYYLPGKTGWTSTLGGRPAVLWNPQAQTADGSFGIQNNHFGFTITASTNIPIVVEASHDLRGTNWTLVQNCTVTNGSIYFSDPNWKDFPIRFYRIRSP